MNKRIEKKISRKGMTKEGKVFFNRIKTYQRILDELDKTCLGIMREMHVKSEDLIKYSEFCGETPTYQETNGPYSKYEFKFEGIRYFSLFSKEEEYEFFNKSSRSDDTIEINGVKYKKAD